MPPTPPRVNPSTSSGRHRRRPEDAEAEILDATRELLNHLPAHEITVSAVMQATTLSRKSFYVYFADRNALWRRLLKPLAAERDAIIDRIYAANSLTEAGPDALLGLACFYAEHGRLLRAFAYASVQDDDTRQAWRAFMEPVIEAHVQLLAAEIAAGRINGIDPEPTVRALIAMNLQYFFDELVDASEPDVDGVTATLLTIWSRTLYGGDSATSPA